MPKKWLDYLTYIVLAASLVIITFQIARAGELIIDTQTGDVDYLVPVGDRGAINQDGEYLYKLEEYGTGDRELYLNTETNEVNEVRGGILQ